jgi:hypothetical protein
MILGMQTAKDPAEGESLLGLTLVKADGDAEFAYFRAVSLVRRQFFEF